MTRSRAFLLDREAPRPRLPLAMTSMAAIVVLVVIGILVAQRVSQVPAANTDYSVGIAPGVRPVTPNAQVAAIARHYLDEQTPSLAAPGIHVPPIVFTVTATLARDARQIEPGIPVARVAEQPDRIVWIVRATGDFLILHDLPWSSQGTPLSNGNIVIDDASRTILGVYPHAAGE